MSLPLKVRPMNENDKAFIVQTWVKSYRAGNDFVKLIPPPYYYPGQKDVINKALAISKTDVACDPENEDVIYGWASSMQLEEPVFHYAYVKSAFRGFGIGRILIGDLLKENGLVSHWQDRYAKLDRYIRYNPYIFTGGNSGTD